MHNNKINKYQEWFVTQANNYFPKGTVTAAVEETTNDPGLIIELDEYEPKIFISIASMLHALVDGEKTEISCLTAVLKTIEQAAARIPYLSKNTYYGEVTA